MASVPPCVTKTKSEDTLTVVEQVKQFVERERQLAAPVCNSA
ncbi:MAG: hypothetical protein R3F53_05725 [Gammaproteobacteria bacterium]